MVLATILTAIGNGGIGDNDNTGDVNYDGSDGHSSDSGADNGGAGSELRWSW